MSIDILSKLFGNINRVKILKLFLFNTNTIFEKREILKLSKVAREQATKELNMLEKIGFIKKRSFFKAKKNKRTGEIKKKRVQGYAIVPEFNYLKPLQNLLIHSAPVQEKDLIKKMNKVGTIREIIIAGVFIQDEDSRLDLMVVGDKISKRKFTNTVSTIESELGKQLRYAVFDTDDFKYRISMYDRLIRDVLDYPHVKVLDRLNLEEKYK